MARGRMISRTLGSSRKFASLHKRLGKLSEFAQALYPLLVSCSDDFGRQSGDAFTVQKAVFPSSPRREEDFTTVLTAMHEVGLIRLYEVDAEIVLQIVDFDKHQPGLHRRTESQYPAGSPLRQDDLPPSPLNASEREIEDFLTNEIRTGALVFGNHHIVSIERQVRVRQFYMDVVAKTETGMTLLIEVKRQRVTSAALDQIRGYRKLIDGDVEMVVIGHGLSAGLDTAVTDVLIGSYDDSLQCEPVNVDLCSRTFTHIRSRPRLMSSEENRTELKRTEGKGRELNGTKIKSTAAPRRIFNSENSGTFGLYCVIAKEAIAKSIEIDGTDNAVNVAEHFKNICAKRQIDYDSTIAAEAVESCLVARVRRHA